MGTASRGFGVARDGTDRGVLSIETEVELISSFEVIRGQRSDHTQYLVGNRHDRRRAKSLLARNLRALTSAFRRIKNGMILRRQT